MNISDIKCGGCGHAMQIQKLHCEGCGVQVEGRFEFSALAQLSPADQVFSVAFLRSHGSIKQMEKLFGISYPTVKNRLNAIIRELDRTFEAPSANTFVLDQLGRGEISVAEALERLS
jgi:hypothetical protein